MNKLKRIILLLSIISIIFTFKSNTQAQMPDCLPGVNWGLPKNAYMELEPFKYSGSVQYYERIVGGKVEITADWSTLWNNKKPISDETMKELFTIFLAQRYSDDPCQYPVQLTTVSIIDKTECYIPTKCRVKLDMGLESQCCDDPSINPPIYEFNGQWYLNYYKNQPCGFKCCEKIITLFCQSVGTNLSIKVVQNITNQDYPGSECSGTSPYIDCLTNEPIHCEGNCD